MSKGCATATAVRNAVFSALIAREGMTGPAQPFEGRDGLWQLVTGPFKELRLPPTPPGATLSNSKRFPTEGYTQALMPVVPEITAWTKAEDISAIQIEMSRLGALEIGEPAKWDPRNRETADHNHSAGPFSADRRHRCTAAPQKCLSYGRAQSPHHQAHFGRSLSAY
jgi:2-methylcitrate dehydratase